MEDGPMTAVCEDRTGTGTQDTKQSDLASLEKRSDRTLQNVRGVKQRLAKLLEGIRRAEPCETDSNKEIAPQPKNRISSIENCIGFIDSEGEQINSIIFELEEILK